MTTFTEISIDKITAHPKNIRRHVEADDDMVESIKAHGIITAITVVADDDGYYQLIGGHRRLDGAKKAGLTQLPAMVRDDLTTDAEHIEAMAIENVHRQDLTAIEEADAYEQLALLGYNAAKIAKVTGRATTTVTARLKLAHLTKKAKEAIHVHDMTIEDGIKLASLEDHPKILKKVEKAIGTHNFSWELANAVRDIEREAEYVKKRAEYEKRGLPKITKPKEWDYENGPRRAYDDDSADAWCESDYGPELIITKVEPRKMTAAEKRAEAQREADAAAAKQRSKDLETSRRARLEHLAGSVGALKIPKHLTEIFAHAIGQQLSLLSGKAIADVNRIAGTDIVRAKDAPQWAGSMDGTIVTQVREISAAKLPGLLMATMALSAEHLLYGTDGWNATSHSVWNAMSYLAAVETSGYPMSDVDQSEVDRLSKRFTELEATEKAKADKAAAA